MGLRIRHVREEIVRPALQHIGAHSPDAEALLMLTGWVESDGFQALRQYGSGPARGLFQMEPATHADIWENWIAYRESRRTVLVELIAGGIGHRNGVAGLAEQLSWNHRYSAAMCRYHYLRVPAALPSSSDYEAMGAYWKTFYNSALGAGDAAEAATRYHEMLTLERREAPV